MIISPLADSPDIILLRCFKAQDLIREWKHSFNIDITEELRGHDAVYLYRCKKTDLQFFLPTSICGSPTLYASLQQYHWYYMPNRWEHDVAIRKLADSQSILEVGSGFGSFVKFAYDAGLPITGIEINQDAAKAAQSKGLPVTVTDLFSQSNDWVDRFDAICAFQVLEHLPDPKNFITSSLRLLKTEGKLILSVPNSASYIKHQFNLLDMPPHHMTRWSKKTLRALEAIFPLQLEEILVEPLPAYQAQGYLSAYTEYLRSISVILKIFVNRFTVPFYSATLKTVLRNLLKGQTLYAQFRKIQ